jgi:hypothetical protein
MSSSADKWIHLDFFEKRCYQNRIQAYDQIMATTDDLLTISSCYQIPLEQVQQAKDYAFGSGVSRLEHQFIKALKLCQSLNEVKYQSSTLPCQAIHLFCEVGKNPSSLLLLSEKYGEELAIAKTVIEQYARSVDNWKVENCPFGVKDHCNLLHFFLNLKSQDFRFFRGMDWTPQMICELLKDWKGIDLTPLISPTPVNS